MKRIWRSGDEDWDEVRCRRAFAGDKTDGKAVGIGEGNEDNLLKSVIFTAVDRVDKVLRSLIDAANERYLMEDGIPHGEQ